MHLRVLPSLSSLSGLCLSLVLLKPIVAHPHSHSLSPPLLLRWFHFVKEHEQLFFRRLCRAQEWETPYDFSSPPPAVRVLRPLPDNSPATPPRARAKAAAAPPASPQTPVATAKAKSSRAASAAGDWRYIFATRYLVARKWLSGHYRALQLERSPSGAARPQGPFYMMPMAAQAWGDALDAC